MSERPPEFPKTINHDFINLGEQAVKQNGGPELSAREKEMIGSIPVRDGAIFLGFLIERHGVKIDKTGRVIKKRGNSTKQAA